MAIQNQWKSLFKELILKSSEKITIQSIADKLGVSRSYVSREVKVSVKMINRIREAYRDVLSDDSVQIESTVSAEYEKTAGNIIELQSAVHVLTMYIAELLANGTPGAITTQRGLIDDEIRKESDRRYDAIRKKF